MKKKTDKFDIEAWLEKYIYNQVDDPCIDNFRWAVLGDVEQMEAYKKAAAEGCCGSFDSEVTAPNGLTYKVGCNYGH
jgi:hypothetical protein